MKKYFTGRLPALFLVLSFFSGPVSGTFGTLLAIGGETDIRKRIIPNTVCILISLLGVAEIVTGYREQVKWQVLNVVLAIILLVVMKLILKDGVGMGDIKLLLACSFCLSVSSLMAGFALACLIAGVTGVVVTKSLKGEVPLGPFLAVSMTLVKMAETV